MAHHARIAPVKPKNPAELARLGLDFAGDQSVHAVSGLQADMKRGERLSVTARDLEAQISGLKTASLESLQHHWRSAFSKPYPDHLPRQLIASMLAYRLQAKIHDDLSPQHKKYLGFVGRTLSKMPHAPVPKFSVEGRQFKVGTVFIREHAGVQHRVIATKEGLLWDNATYPSLSAVARAITGTNWNGRRFFGLAKASN